LSFHIISKQIILPCSLLLVYLFLYKIVSLLDKLNQANKVVEDFEKRTELKRYNLKMVMPEDFDIQEQLEKIYEKIKIKYNEDFK